MPGALKQKDLLLPRLIDKFKAISDKDPSDIWENELKQEAKKVFTMLPLKEFSDSVFKQLRGLSSNSTTFSQSKRMKSKKNLAGSGSIGSISSRIRSMSLNGSQTDLNERKQVILNIMYDIFCY